MIHQRPLSGGRQGRGQSKKDREMYMENGEAYSPGEASARPR